MGNENFFGGGRVEDAEKAEAMARASKQAHEVASFHTERGDPLYARASERGANNDEELAGVIYDLQRLLESNKIHKLPDEKLQILKYVVNTLLE